MTPSGLQSPGWRMQRRQFLRWSIAAASLPMAAPIATLAQSALPVDSVRAMAFALIPDNDAPETLYDTVARGFVADHGDAVDDLLALFPESPGDLPAARAGRIVEALSSQPLLTDLRRRTATAVYTSPEVWQRIGYGGSSLEFGGYLGNGFDDIDWLPEFEP